MHLFSQCNNAAYTMRRTHPRLVKHVQPCNKREYKTNEDDQLTDASDQPNKGIVSLFMGLSHGYSSTLRLPFTSVSPNA
jgi:hypothetical protein